MNYRYLGKSGLKVSELCFGAMSFTGKSGWTQIAETTQSEANDIVAFLLDHGVNFFDTADSYSEGVSETMLGKALGSRRMDMVLTTKCGFRMGSGPNDVGLSRTHVINACDASLKRLETDYIDLYLVHSYDFVTPIDETLNALDFLVKQGKVRYIGVSNFTAWHLMKALAVSEKNGWEKFVNIQAYYSLLGREVELELVPLCLDQGVGLTVWSPLHGGILSGKYHRQKQWPRNTRIKNKGESLPSDPVKEKIILDELFKIAESHKVSVAQVALNYLLKKPAVTSLVIGARNMEQLKDNLQTVGWNLSDEEMDLLDRLSSPPSFYPHWYFDIFRKERRYW